MTTAASRVAVLVCVIVLLAACGGGTIQTVERTAAQRFDDAVALIAKALGKTTTEVKAGIKIKLPTASADELAAQAERTAARTAEIERLGALEAQAAAKRAQAAAREEEMIATLYGATCDWVAIAYELSSSPPEERSSRFTTLLVAKLADHGFDTGDSNVEALGTAVNELWVKVAGDSDLPVEKIAADLACFAS